MRLAWFASLPWAVAAKPKKRPVLPAVSTQPNMFVSKQNDVKPLQWKVPGPPKNNSSKLQQYEQPKHGINHPVSTLKRSIDLRLRPHTCSSLCLPSSNSCISSDHLGTMRYLCRCGCICVWSGWVPFISKCTATAVAFKIYLIDSRLGSNQWLLLAVVCNHRTTCTSFLNMAFLAKLSRTTLPKIWNLR